MIHLLGGPPRVRKSLLTQVIVGRYSISWLPTDVIRTVLRQNLPDLHQLDTGRCPRTKSPQYVSAPALDRRGCRVTPRARGAAHAV